MLEHAVYSLISPEGCASILWRSAKRAPDAADALKITAAELLRLKIIDGIVYEPPGGAHRDPALTLRRLAIAIGDDLAALQTRTPAELRADRSRKYLQIG
jgi:acetyl-CoA carboxylase carboxyl transferase subunit alpha